MGVEDMKNLGGQIKLRRLQSQKGNALLETLPILVIFTLLIAYSLGFFGVVHTGILNSIAARTYAFETFRNRTELKMFRDTVAPGEVHTEHWTLGNRMHAITSEKNADGSLGDGQFASSRPLAIGRKVASSDAKQSDHNVGIYNLDARNRKVNVSPAWIMTGYGICLNADCGDGRKTYEFK